MTLFILHAASALFMTGLVWFVQIVHYTLLHHVGTTSFHHYEADHTRRTSPVVAPVMLFELASGVWLALAPPTGVESTLLLANAVLLAVIWGSTFVLQTPLHRQLSRGFAADRVDRLVSTNWIRTAVWTVRSALLVFVLLALTEPSPTPTRKPLPDVPSLPPIQGVLLK
jgi:hypothetical protein